jgi:tRNA-2-methylthio-N6-dimethylallyladenosine synthase
MLNNSKTYFIKTFGCQANKADSERIAASLEKKGLKETQDIKEADLVVINTCSVRQSAEDRIGGLVRNLVLQRKRTKRPKKIILTGCALYHGKAWLRKKFKNIDEFIPTTDLTDPKVLPKRKEKTHAWVPIMEGCSHFCTYCVVPLARGREISRPFEEIVCEVKELARRGYKEITLLGQNVNSYGKDIENLKLKMRNEKLKLKIKNLRNKFKNHFALLLAVLNEIEGLEKISFITSNPWDLTDNIIEAMALPKIERYLHLPVQSGDNEILRRMNRPYTARQYIKLVEKIRQKIPDIKIGTDIIVGFPGETKEQFQNTINLCQKIGFSVGYIAQYSPRPGTAAYKLSDDIPYKEKKRRWKILDDLINKPGVKN